jgi:thiol-disulfide isomerase/thioredoxin
VAHYAQEALRGQAVYRGYRPRTPLLQQVGTLLPQAHVLVISAPWCADCRREVPKFARILEALPAGWTAELRGDDEDTRTRYTVRAIPTFLVLAGPDGPELGRIIESPASSDGLEGDLLAIAQRAHQAQRAA